MPQNSGLLEGRKRRAKIVAVLGVNFAWGEPIAVEQHRGFDDQRGSLLAAWGAAALMDSAVNAGLVTTIHA
jgi:hypothetical protein